MSQICISDVQAWMHNNKLQLYPDKTEMIIFTSKRYQHNSHLPSEIGVNGSQISVSSYVRNLGVTLDQNLSFQQHVSKSIKPAISSFEESAPFVTISPKMFSRPWFVLSSCLKLTTVTLYSLAVQSISSPNFREYKTMQPATS